MHLMSINPKIFIRMFFIIAVCIYILNSMVFHMFLFLLHSFMYNDVDNSCCVDACWFVIRLIYLILLCVMFINLHGFAWIVYWFSQTPICYETPEQEINLEARFGQTFQIKDK